MGKSACRLAAPLWFRRWSRSRAAVFHSLRSVVLIGRLRTSVLLSLGRKSMTLSVELCREGASPLELGHSLPGEVEDDTKLALHLMQYASSLAILTNDRGVSSRENLPCRL